jgi:hypothetical protein
MTSFQSIRLAQTATLALENTFQAVIIDTPVQSGSVHSPYKQPVGSRLARGGLAVGYGLTQYTEQANPIATSAKKRGMITNANVVVTIAGVVPTAGGLTATIGSNGFEVLNGTTWTNAPIISFGRDVFPNPNATIVTIGPVPAHATAVRYLWYGSPCGMIKYECPVTAKVQALGSLSGQEEFLPLGPFVMALS